MRLSYNWLKQYVDFNESPDELSKILVNLGLEVEGLEKWQSVKGGLEGFVIGEVLTCTKHPNADKLSLTKVNVGNDEPLSIVCGAPNVAAGQKVVVAVEGTTVFSGNDTFKIEKRKARGESSEGMICAEDEMGLGTSHAGILVLKADAVPGTPANKYFEVENDFVFEIGISPNRIDCASHYGTASDLATFFNLHGTAKLSKPSIDSFKSDNNSLPVEVIIKNTDACQRYSGVSIKGVTIKESPEWLKNRLNAIGLRPINNVVDITNFVLFETGQPLHAFDADKIHDKKVIVSPLPEGTSFTTLDSVERKLNAEDLIICDTKGGMCIAGVFGGVESGVTESTTNIFLESAYFTPSWVRRTAKRHGLSTDSSFRFERGTDPNGTIYALKRATLLIKELAGGEIASEVVDVYPKPVENTQIDITYKGIYQLIGKEIGVDIIKKILKLLDITIEKENTTGLTVSVPPFRVDVKCEADIVEDVLRIYGFNNVEVPVSVNASLSYAIKPDALKATNKISDSLSANGFNEIMSNSLTKSAYYEPIDNYKNKIVYILNPLSSDLNCMRQTHIFGGLEAIIRNINFRNSNLKLYEFGNCYFIDKTIKGNNELDKYSEAQYLTLFITGNEQESDWNNPARKTSFYTLKTFVVSVFDVMGLSVEQLSAHPLNHSLIENGLSYTYNNKQIADIGTIKRSVLKSFDIEQEVFAGEIHWTNLLALTADFKKTYKELPKFPEVRRDLALLIDEKTAFETIKEIAESVDKKLIRQVGLFDIYQGDKIDKGKKSYWMSLVLRDDNKTLTDNEIEKVMSKIKPVE